jgi:HEAT repeat protein
VEFLRQLIQDPSRIPAYEEGVRVMDQIASMTPNDVNTALPVIFEALSSQRQMAQLEGALALHAVAIRSDGAMFLGSRVDQILGLLENPEARLKMTAVIVAEKVHAPAAEVAPAFLSFIAEQSQPVEVKPGVIGALVRMTGFSAASARAIGAFFSRTSNPTVRIDTLNAIASNPVDDPAQADLIILGLRDSNENVRSAAIHILKRLGPKAASRATADLLKIAQNPTESVNVRRSAEQTIANH